MLNDSFLRRFVHANFRRSLRITGSGIYVVISGSILLHSPFVFHCSLCHISHLVISSAEKTVLGCEIRLNRPRRISTSGHLGRATGGSPNAVSDHIKGPRHRVATTLGSDLWLATQYLRLHPQVCNIFCPRNQDGISANADGKQDTAPPSKLSTHRTTRLEVHAAARREICMLPSLGQNLAKTSSNRHSKS